MKPIERTVQKPSESTAISAALRAFTSITGSGAPSRGHPQKANRALSALLSLAIFVTFALVSVPASAEVQHNFLSQITEVPAGSGAPVAGRFSEPWALALDGGGDVYVVDPRSEVIDEFGPSGDFLSQIGVGPERGREAVSVAVNDAGSEVYFGNGSETVKVFGSAGQLLGEWSGKETPSGSFSGLTHVAVDRSTSLSDPAAGDVYVTDALHGVVDVFRPEVGGQEPAPVAQITGVGTPSGEPFEPEYATVDEANGDVLVVNRDGLVSRIDVFAPTTLGGYEYVRQIVGPPGGAFGVRGVSVVEEGSTEGDIYVTEVGTEAGAVYEFSATGAYLTRITGSSREAFSQFVTGVAVTASGQLYVADGSVKAVDVFGPNIVLPDVAVGTVSNLQARSVTLNGTINPDEAGNATCRFEYGTTTAYGQSAPCSVEVPSGNSPVAVSSLGVTGLQPGRTYHFRLDASNAHGTNTGQSEGAADEGEFTTPGPGALSESVVNVASDSATLEAQIDPNGADTHYYFQYGTSTSYEYQSPAAPGKDIGAGSAAQNVSAPLRGLQSSTVYHYRVVASNEVTTSEGPDQTFTTQPPGGTLTLPDGRSWELVSPAQKLGAQVTNEFGLVQSSEEDGEITYPVTAPFVASAAGNTRVAQALSKRGRDGVWTTEDIASPHDGPTLIGISDEYLFFSTDLAHGLLDPLGETPLSSEATEKTPYVRDDATGAYTPLVDPADVPKGTKFGGVFTEPVQGPQFVTATPDLSHVVLSSEVPLTENSPRNAFYEWSTGRLRLITGNGQIGGKGGIVSANLRHAISNDGSRIFWTSGNSSERIVHMTGMTDGQVVDVSSKGGEFQDASSDGSLVFTSSGRALSVYNAQIARLEQMTVPVNGSETPGLQGSILGASDDGSYVYLVASGVLTEAPNATQEKAVSGADNLYLLRRTVNGATEEWTPSFITTLSGDDAAEWQFGPFQTVEVSRGGEYLAFMSDRSLTGYDNRDASSGEPDEEVYRYDAADARLVCASCDPSGARPVGWLEPQTTAEASLFDPGSVWRDRWVAATIPGITRVQGEQGQYEPTYMLNSGQLFFNSRDALVAQDVNGVGDVYEYESGGEGDCPASSSGCVALLSGGTGARTSGFAGASASGNDVFFLTEDGLVSQDRGNDYDMYDAHVCSANAPCVSTAVAPPPCDTADSCKAALSSQPGVFGAPPSATFNGAGNVVPRAVSPKTVTKKRTVKCKRGFVKQHGKCAKRKSSKKAKQASRDRRGQQ